MKIFELLRNPLIKTIGIIAILYFALFSNKESPESLGNRLSPQQIKQDFNEIKSKSSFIASNIKIAKEVAKEREESNKNFTQTTIEDLEEGDGETKVSCGDEVEISYGIYAQTGQQLEFFDSKKIIIGGKTNSIIEKNIIGMKKGGIRIIRLPRNLISEDTRLMELQKFSADNLYYQVMTLSFSPQQNTNTSCQ